MDDVVPVVVVMAVVIVRGRCCKASLMDSSLELSMMSVNMRICWLTPCDICLFEMARLML